MKKNLLLAVLILFTISIFAENEADKGWLRGKIKDSSNKQPVEYATIAVYSTTDNSLVDGAISGLDGSFKIPNLNPGSYYIAISFIGYEEKQVKEITIDRNGEKKELGEIFIDRATQELEEVQVIGNKGLVEYEIDKKVINVSQQQTTASGTAVDILEKIPSVRVDVEGNVSLRGSGGFKVLIDGKPSVLEPSEALQQIPATTIDNIEIITNPSAKYDPDGVAGIINIITKKQRLQGVSGIANANYGLYDNYGADVLINVKNSKINYYIGADFNHRNFPGTQEIERETYLNDTTYFVNSNGDSRRSFERRSIRAGLDFNLTEKDNIALSVRYGRFEMENESDLEYFEQTSPASTAYSYLSDEFTFRGGNFLSATLDYTHNFEKKGHKIISSVNFRDREMEEENLNQLFTLANETLEGRKTTEVGPSRIWRIKTDYTLPISKTSKFEAGVQARVGFSGDDTDVYDLLTSSDTYEQLPDFTNGIEYERDIYSVYSQYAGEYQGIGYQVGLRGEYTYRDIFSKNTNEEFTIDRFDYFPSLHFSYSMPGENQIMASYSKRIERARGWYLEPFITYEDAYNVRQGNPALLPEYIDSYELGYMKSFQDNSFSLEAYYRITHNKVERVRSVFDEDVMLRTFANIGDDYALGTEMMFNYNVSKIWNMNLIGDLYQYRVKGQLDNQSFDNESFNWRINFDNTFNLPQNLKIQVSNQYSSPTVTSQGTFEGFYVLNMAIKKEFFDRVFSANLQARDVLATAFHEFTSEGADFYMHNYFERRSPMIMLTLTYRFHNYRPDRRMMNGGGGDGDDF